ncbi:hypothetical protein [Streptomyces candidus]|uniref:DUF3040 domain-containing protein n=1 Tax=Streptomyces candidus TaxID=67283 RepID=A0A7X0LN26_9ACTN|nr:hypothetical protein [Streptomyces candidus]MBB6434427.1 hypothetical protein [Streptomyces candidus]GHH36758.1 hypothetical protein GCM10018773_12310 [Streptomyces candidus]
MSDPPTGTEQPEPSLPDDVWEQFERDSEARIRAGAPKEPSARARMVAERLRLQDEEAARRQGRRWGRRRKRVPARPDGWRAWPEGRRNGGGRDWFATLVVLGVTALVLVLVLYPWGGGRR